MGGIDFQIVWGLGQESAGYGGGLVMDGRDSSATLGMTWVTVRGNDRGMRWISNGGGTFVKVPPRPLKTFGVGSLRVLWRAAVDG